MSQKTEKHIKHLDQLKYPLGVFEYNPKMSVKSSLLRIESLPDRLETLLNEIKPHQLKWAYRPQGWQLLQLVHHISDSHVNAYIRTRMAYSFSGSTIAPYDENSWAKFPDSMSSDLSNSLELIFSIHQKWVTFLGHLSDSDLEKTYYHPADKAEVSIKEAIQMYAWHGDHHHAHLVQGLNSKGKY